MGVDVRGGGGSIERREESEGRRGESREERGCEDEEEGGLEDHSNSKEE